MSRSLSRTSGRRFSSRSGSRKLLTSRQANRRFAKRKVEWIVPFSATCGEFCATPGDLCPNGGSIVLLNNSELITKFEDVTRIVRIEGDLFFQPTAPSGNTCSEFVSNAGKAVTMFRAGLKKSQVTQANSGVPIAYNPLKSGAAPEDLSDYGDGKWLKLWPAHLFEPTQIISFSQPPPTCCSVVSGGNSVNVITDGTGNIDTSISTECQPCPTSGDPLCTVGVQLPKYHHIRVAFNRPIRMSGDDSLAIYFGWEQVEFCGDTARHVQANMQLSGQLRMLMEK